MASLIDELIQTLEKENKAYQELHVLSTQKTDIIVKGDIQALTDIVEKEQILMTNQVQPLEKKRRECTNDIATVISRKPEDLTLSKLIELMGSQPETQKRLSEVRDKLQDTMKQMVKVNDMNKVLLKESLELVEFDINLFNSMRQAPLTANYDRNAYNVGEHMRVPRAFDKSQ